MHEFFLKIQNYTFKIINNIEQNHNNSFKKICFTYHTLFYIIYETSFIKLLLFASAKLTVHSTHSKCGQIR